MCLSSSADPQLRRRPTRFLPTARGGESLRLVKSRSRSHSDLMAHPGLLVWTAISTRTRVVQTVGNAHPGTDPNERDGRRAMGHPLPPSPRSGGSSASVTPCLVSGVRNMASGRETAAQSADSQLFSGSLRQSSAGAAMRPVLAVASEPSAEPEILRRVTGSDRVHPDPFGMALRVRARRIHLATGIRGYGRHEAVGVRAQPFPSRPGGEVRGHQSY